MSTSRCGTCTMCCKLMEVPELSKPINTWCTHCAIGKGCTIYEKRPMSCRSFECYYYANKELPEELRPDNCKVMIETLSLSNTLVAYVESSRPDAWRSDKIMSWFKKLLSEGHAIVVVSGKEKNMLLPENKTAEQVWQDVINEYKFKQVNNGSSSV